MNNKKPIYEKMWFWVLIVWIIMSVFIAMCITYNHLIDYAQQRNQVIEEQPIVEEIPISEEQLVVEENSIIEEEPVVEEIKSEYLTKGEWALYEVPYAFSVEVDDYNGDVFKAGSYKFQLIGGKFKAREYMPALFGIYITDKNYLSVFDLQQDFEDATFYVGGNTNTSFQYELKAGQYVFIVHYDNLALSPKGFLSFEIIK